MKSPLSLSSSEFALQVRNRLWVHGLWILPFLALAAPIVVSLWRKWNRDIFTNGHGMFVPVAVALLAHYALRREPVKSEAPSPWGFAFLVPALALVVLDAVIWAGFLREIGLLLCLPGLALLLLGRRRTRVLLVPLGVSFLMLPIPPYSVAPIHDLLQLISTAGGEWLLHAMSLPALAEGILLHLPHGILIVARPCSGFSALYAAIAVSLVLAYLSHTWAQRIILLAVAVPLAVGGNVLRIAGLAILAEWHGFSILKTPAHILSGYASFVFTLSLLFLLAHYLPPRRRTA